ncbi:MAG: phospholipase D family protein [Gammaproteobacteria bacterium]|nr:phospholipase D family protein [Gammaproteobacteria bacterium]MDH5630849.1 phospholipase D family protein [Gammaproteobacteria bacterium]
MKIVSNTFGSHGKLVSELLSDSPDELFLVSPFLANDFEEFLGNCDFSSIRKITLITTLKKNDQDQITKPTSLKSFYQLMKNQCPNAQVEIHIDNSLHGKIYIFKKGSELKAIVTSANLTKNGFYNNNEWGLLIGDNNIITQLEKEVLECIEYPDITEFLVEQLLSYSDQFQRDNPECKKIVKPTSDILDTVYYLGQNNNKEPKYYLKPIGVSENPILKDSKRDFSELHQNLHFSKKGTGTIKTGDILITTAVGCGCLLSYFQVTGTPKEATDKEKQIEPWKERWPWYIEGRNLSTKYGGCWWEYDLTRKKLLKKYQEEYPNEAVTLAGRKTLGTLNFGNDKVQITKTFAEFLIAQIDEFNK